MKMLQLVTALSAGVVAGIIGVVACSDGASPSDAGAQDAAGCECPAPKPMQQRVRVVEGTLNFINGSGDLYVEDSAVCNADEIPISGSCPVTSTEKYVAGSGRIDGQAYRCRWLNLGKIDTAFTGYPMQMNAQVVCLEKDPE
jgi:hypothetical protein